MSSSRGIDDRNTGEIVMTPNCNDVLCGRGSGVNTFSGNIFFRELVRVRKEMYRKVKRHQKIPIAEEIIDTITNLDPPGRFLIRNKEGTCWYVHSRKQSMVKTAQALREGATKRERMIDGFANQGSSGSVNSGALGHSYSCGGSSSDGEDHFLPDQESILAQQHPVGMISSHDIIPVGITPRYLSQSIYPPYNSSTGMNGTSMLVVAQQLQQQELTQQPPVYINQKDKVLLQQVFREKQTHNKVFIPPLANHSSLCEKYHDDNSGRFDDPVEEQMDTSLQVFIAAVQMRRRMLAG